MSMDVGLEDQRAPCKRESLIGASEFIRLTILALYIFDVCLTQLGHNLKNIVCLLKPPIRSRFPLYYLKQSTNL